MNNPILDEIAGLSPAAQEALRQAHTAMAGGTGAAPVTPAAPVPLRPPQQAVPALGASPAAPDASSLGPMAPMPSLPGAPNPLPSSLTQNAPAGTTDFDKNRLAHLKDTGSGISQIHSKIEDSDFGQKHPFLGKVLGWGAEIPARLADAAGSVLAPAIDARLPGTEMHHQILLNQTSKQLGADETNAQREAVTAATKAEIPVREAQADAQELTPLTADEAKAAGNPLLEGIPFNAAQRAALLRQAGINTTKETTNKETVQGKEDVAHTNADARRDTETMAANAKKYAADAQERAREAAARIRAATGGTKAGAANKVTNNSRARGEMAETVLAQAPQILQEIDQASDKIGPGAGRWNNWWVKKAGANDPEYAALDQDLSLYASAIVVAHFGARGGGQHFIEQMRRDFTQAQSPEDLKARILHADKWMEGYAQIGKGETPGAGTKSFTDNGVTYNIPADKVDAFKKDHPNAK